MDDGFKGIEDALSDVPVGRFLVERNLSAGGKTLLERHDFRSRADAFGKGRMQVYCPFPGLEVSFNQWLGSHLHFQHEELAHVLSVNFCHRGRIGWHLKGGRAVYLGSGDVSLHTMACCAHSDAELPLGYFEGIGIMIDTAVLKTVMPDIAASVGITGQGLRAKFHDGILPFTLIGSKETAAIFEPLYAQSRALRLPYCKLKVQELLLFLWSIEGEKAAHIDQYTLAQTERIKAIHALLTEDLSKRYTIETLAKRFAINTSTLKATFKAVYGLPIAAYMKNYRVQRAKILLRTTALSIAEIAAQVGYESQSKFTQAFKALEATTPMAYRKLYAKA